MNYINKRFPIVRIDPSCPHYGGQLAQVLKYYKSDPELQGWGDLGSGRSARVRLCGTLHTTILDSLYYSEA